MQFAIWTTAPPLTIPTEDVKKIVRAARVNDFETPTI